MCAADKCAGYRGENGIMCNEIIVKYCSPTLANIKTGSLFTMPIRDCENCMDMVRTINRKLVPKGLRFLVLKKTESSVLFYMYRPQLLKKDLFDQEALSILNEAGYVTSSSDLCVIHLMKRLRESEGFPHEIGLFLGYPPEDVRGFITNGGKNCKCVGTWKVYGDTSKALELFCRYKKCTAMYCRYYRRGLSIESLAVA